MIDFRKQNMETWLGKWNIVHYKYTIHLCCMVGAVGKISAFRTQGPQFDPRLFLDINICATSFPPNWLPAYAGS